MAATDCVSVAGVLGTRLPAPSSHLFRPRSSLGGGCSVAGGPSHGGSCPCGLVHHELPIRFAHRSMYGLSSMSQRRVFLAFTFFAFLLGLFWVAVALDLFGFDA